jgi:N-acetylglutamate synthase-like GNAT family acetyltransferase
MKAPLTPPWRFRPYQASDKGACLKVFESNMPKYFLPAEKEKFSAYLDELPQDYLLVEDDSRQVIAGGGYALGLDGGAATLCWGMVHKDWHGHGIGQFMLWNRLSKLAQIPKMKLIRLDATQHSVEFFMKKGFKTYRITRNYYGPDLHHYEMYMILDDEKIREILTAK